MKKLLLSLFALLYLQHEAQVWCTPGSVWRSGYSSIWATGYKVLEYKGDTLLGTKLCNKLKETRFVPAYPISLPRYYFTYVDSLVVYLLDQSTGNFDTLYNFGAKIGDTWRHAPTSRPRCAASHVTVTDTGHVIIQGQSLRSFTLSQVRAQPTLGSAGLFGPVYERLGAIECYPYYADNMCPWGTDAYIGAPLTCFSDDQISDYKHNFNGSCDTYLSVNELTHGGAGLVLYPNPSPGIFGLELPMAGAGQEIRLTVTDITGREIKRLMPGPVKRNIR